MPSRIALIVVFLVASACDHRAADPSAASAHSTEACGHHVHDRSPDHAPAMAMERGPGPVYIGLGSRGTVHFTDGAPRYEGRYYYEAVVGIAPSFRGAVTLNGRRRDGREVLKWHNGPLPGRQLGVLSLGGPTAAPAWRYWAGDLLFAAPGCYTIRVEGAHLAEAITFRAKP